MLAAGARRRRRDRGAAARPGHRHRGLPASVTRGSAEETTMAPNRRLLAAGTLAFTLAASGLVLAGCDTLFPKRGEGEKLWRDRCSQCHGIGGDGNTPQYMGNYAADLNAHSWPDGSGPRSRAGPIRP